MQRSLQRRARRERITVSAFFHARHLLADSRGSRTSAPKTWRSMSICRPITHVMTFDPAASDVAIRCYTSDELRTQLQRREWRGVEAGRFLGETMTLVCSPALATGDCPRDAARHRAARHKYSKVAQRPPVG